MQTVFYKKFFELRLFHQLAPTALCTAFGLLPTKQCAQLLKNYKMQWRSSEGKITIFYSGNLVPDEALPNKKITPLPAVVPDGTEFLFVVTLLEPSIISYTVIPTEADISVTDKNIPIPFTFIKPATLSLRLPATVNTKPYESFQVLTQNNVLVQTDMIKKDDGGFYNCTADLTLLPPDIYSFTLESDNAVRQNFYVDTPGETLGQYGFLRLVKDGTWLLPDKIVPAPAMPDYNVFNYTFQKT